MATRTISDIGGNWNDASSWVEAAVPTSSDDVVATETSGNLTINTADAWCLTLILTGYTGTLTFSEGQTLTVTTTVTFASDMTISGTGTLRFYNSATITSADKTFTGSVIFYGGTWTLADSWLIEGSVQFTSATNILNEYAMTIGGSFQVSRTVQGTTEFILNGTGDLYCASGMYISSNISINTDYTITIGTGGYFNLGVSTLSHTSGTVLVASGSTLQIYGNCTIDVDTTWENFYCTTSYTITLNQDLKVAHNLSTINCNLTFLGSCDIYCASLYLTNNLTSVTDYSFTIIEGQTLYISTLLSLSSSATAAVFLRGAGTGSYLDFQGDMANQSADRSKFYLLDASLGNPILCYEAASISDCENIFDIDNSDFPLPVDVKADVSYAGGAYTGTLESGEGSISDVFGIVA